MYLEADLRQRRFTHLTWVFHTFNFLGGCELKKNTLYTIYNVYTLYILVLVLLLVLVILSSSTGLEVMVVAAAERSTWETDTSDVSCCFSQRRQMISNRVVTIMMSNGMSEWRFNKFQNMKSKFMTPVWRYTVYKGTLLLFLANDWLKPKQT